METVMGWPAISTYAAFWPAYLAEHRKPATRVLHYVATMFGLGCMPMAAVTRQPWWLAGTAASFVLGWAAHVVIEGNRPLGVRYFVWSLVSDLRMLALALTGRLSAEITRCTPDHPAG